MDNIKQIQQIQLKPPQPNAQPPRRPNDTGSISVEGVVRIFDPATKEVFVEQRA